MMMEVVKMKLSYNKKSKDPIYYVQQGIRNGKKTTTRNVERIGKHSDLLKITDDPLAYAKERVKQLNENNKKGNLTVDYIVDFNEKVTPTNHIVPQSNFLNIGYFILQSIYHDLKIKDFFHAIDTTSKRTFDSNEINRFLTFARILEPKSKRGTYDDLNKYFEQPTFDYHQILRFMDVLYENYNDYVAHLYQNSLKVVKRDLSVFYFDCTNYYFEIETEDEDYIDEVTGEIIKGFRKYGPSKQHQPAPLVQMGLFMDADGIPISMNINPGSDNEQKNALPLEREIVKMTKGKPFIYCADAGLGSLNIRKYNSMGNRKFVITQSIKNLSDNLKEAVFNDFNYKLVSNNNDISLDYMQSFDKLDPATTSLYNDTIYKIEDVTRAVDLGIKEEKRYKNGHVRMVKSKGQLNQQLIITFSRKYMEYQRCIRNRQVERAKRLIDNDMVEKSKKGPHDIRRFIKRVKNDKQEDVYEIDQKVIDDEAKYDGFYAIATNLEDDVKTILAINARRYKIEECFRVLKTNFSARPAFHRNKNRIHAHFTICYTALLIYRLLEKKLDDYNTHYTTAQIIQTLRNMNVKNNKDLFYEALYDGGEILSSLNALFPMNLDRRYYRPKDIRKKIKTIS